MNEEDDVVHTHPGILLHQKKEWNNTICCKWMDLKIIILSEESQRNGICNPKKKKKRIKWTFLQNRNRPRDIENKLMVTKDDDEWVGIN